MDSALDRLVFDAESHTYFWDGSPVRSVTQIIKDAGLIDTRFFDDYSRDRGTAVHLATELLDKGILDESSLDPVIIPYLDGWKKFQDEHLIYRWRWIEKRVFHTGLNYAGTLDRLGHVDHIETLIDIKTGDPGRTAQIQMAAYCMAGGVMCRRMAVQLTGDGGYKLHVYPIKSIMEDWTIFQAAKIISDWKKA